jgi:hypothetical protein
VTHDRGARGTFVVAAHATQLATQAADHDAWRRLLTQRLDEQVGALERLGRLTNRATTSLTSVDTSAD